MPLSLATPGARVFLASGADRRELLRLPISVDIDTTKAWLLQASKFGYADFTQPISFDDGRNYRWCLPTNRKDDGNHVRRAERGRISQCAAHNGNLRAIADGWIRGVSSQAGAAKRRRRQPGPKLRVFLRFVTQVTGVAAGAPAMAFNAKMDGVKK